MSNEITRDILIQSNQEFVSNKKLNNNYISDIYKLLHLEEQMNINKLYTEIQQEINLMNMELDSKVRDERIVEIRNLLNENKIGQVEQILILKTLQDWYAKKDAEITLQINWINMVYEQQMIDGSKC